MLKKILVLLALAAVAVGQSSRPPLDQRPGLSSPIRSRPSQSASSGPSTLNDGLTHYWNLDETSGTRSDSIGTTHLSTIVGSPTYVAGKCGNAVSFTTVSQALQTTGTSGLPFLPYNGDLTFAIWAWLDSAGPTGLISAQYVGDGTHDVFNVSVDPYYLWTHLDMWDILENITGPDDATIVSDAWVHIVWQYDVSAKAARFVVNGTPGDYSIASPDILNSNQTSTFSLAWPGYGIIGYLDEGYVWNRLLTNAELTELYAGGSCNSYPF